MTAEEKQAMEAFMGYFATMRKYQKRFFGGDKSSLKTAVYWEKQTDQQASLMVKKYGLVVPESKGGATQGTML